MAQTVQKLQQGFGYDPARSFGNPVYEFTASLFPVLPLGLNTNVLSLVLANLFLFRLPRYFSFLNSAGLLFFRLMLMVMPFFQEAATSSMEYLPAWLVFFETRRAFKDSKFVYFFIGLIVSAFLRIELFVFLSILFFCKPGHHPISLFVWMICLGMLSFYLGWAWGINPAPFADFPSGLKFYGGRFFSLLKQAGLLSPAYFLPFLLFLLPRLRKNYSADIKANLLFFVLCPFEWAYLFPAWLAALFLVFGRTAVQPRFFFLPAAIFLLGLFALSPFSFGQSASLMKRKEQLKWLEWADAQNPEKPEILLFGATFIPVNIREWEKVLDTRIFRKKGTLLYVAERLSGPDLDSLVKQGFSVWVSEGDSVRFSGRSFPVRVARP